MHENHDHPHEHLHEPETDHDETHDCGCAHTCSVIPIKKSSFSEKTRGKDTTVLYISAMDCIIEENAIREVLKDIEGIRRLHFQLASRILSIEAGENTAVAAIEAIQKAGFDIEIATPSSEKTNETPKKKDNYWRLWLAIILAAFVETLSFFAPDTLLIKGVGMALAATAILLSGFSTYTQGLAALRRGRLNINALMAVAVTGAFLIGDWPEAAMVMALYAIAELIEAKSIDRARNTIKGLLDLAPDTVEIRQTDGQWNKLSVNEVVLNDILRVKPGGRIPLDGVVTAGSSTVNQASITGESIPVDKNIGDSIFAGTINESGTLEFSVTAELNDTTLARIIYSVEQAQENKAPVQRFVDRFSAIYTPAIFAIAIGVAVLTPWLLGWSWMQAIYKALVLLVIACPCALVIATPVTIVSGLSVGARRGILIKGGVYLEQARKLRAIAFDKTGTITQGKPKLVASKILPSDIPAKQVLQWAYSLANHSDHPISKSIAHGLDPSDMHVTDFMALPGRGVEATADGQRLILGNHRLIEDRQLCGPHIEACLFEYEKLGYTVTMLASEKQVLAIFAVADTIRESAREAIISLRNQGITSVILTGDNQTTANTIAALAGIQDVRGNLLPEEKLKAIEDLKARYDFTAMVGDGINDAPALAHADIGIALGAASTDIAMEAADIVIMNDDLGRIPEIISLSRATFSILWQNLILALGIKSVFLILAITGNATMWMAIFADMGASLLVVFNGLRLFRRKA